MAGTGRKNRIPSYEALRVIAMLMVLCLHFNYQTGALADTEKLLTPTRVMGGLLESFAIVAVNVYVLISGYFLSKAQWKAERLVRLILQILFYTLLIPLVLSLFHVSIYGTDVWSAVFYILPVSMEHYWFATAYVAMYLFSPVLNAAADHLTRKQLKILILSLLFFTSLLPSISPVKLNTDSFGYSAGWFLVLYLIAAYIRRYGAGRIASGKRAACIYVFSCLGTFVLYLVFHLIYERTGAFAWYMQVPFHYNSVLCLISSIGFFELFRYVKIQDHGAGRLLTCTAPYTFGVYLIHQHLDIRERWAAAVVTLTGEILQDHPFRYLLQMFLGILVLYALCALMDAGRAALFAAAGRGLSRTRAAACLRRMDADMEGRKNSNDQ